MRKAVLFLIPVAAAFGQDSPEARSILNMVAKAAQSGRSYRAEFKASTRTEGSGVHQTVDFAGTLLFQPPDKIRMETKAGSMPILVVGDGKTTWSYMASLKQYVRLPGAGGGSIPGAGGGSIPGGLGMTDLTGAGAGDNVESAGISGEEAMPFDGGSSACYVIAVEYKPVSVAGVSVSKKSAMLWIDKVKYIALRRQDASTFNAPQVAGPLSATMDFAFTRIEWDVTASPEDFTFTPPEGSTEMKLPPLPTAPSFGGAESKAAAPAPERAPERVYNVGGGVSAPRLIHRQEPQYTEEARQARVEGSVGLSLVVAADGAPRDIKVTRSLEAGLDRKAEEAVSKWRFEPGRKGDQPVAVVAHVEVNFRLLHPNAPDRQ